MSIDPNKLLISSDFYSVQGEGKSSGVPSYFVRLGTCNLTCGMSRAFANMLAKEQKLEDGETRQKGDAPCMIVFCAFDQQMYFLVKRSLRIVFEK